MKKRLIHILCILLVISIILSGCTSGSDRISSKENRFVNIGDDYIIGNIIYSIYYDSKTDIVYLFDPNAHRSGVSALYNSDGEPMTLDEYYETR